MVKLWLLDLKGGRLVFGFMRLYRILSRNRSTKPAGAAREVSASRLTKCALQAALAEQFRQEVLEGQLCVEECLFVWVIAQKHTACNQSRACLQRLVVVSRVAETSLPLPSTYLFCSDSAFFSNQSSWSVCASPYAWYLGRGHAASV